MTYRMAYRMIDIEQYITDLLSLAERGVPWVHQGRDPELGVDCVGLLRWGYLQQNAALPEGLEGQFDAYLRRPDGKHLLFVMRTWFDEQDRYDRRRGNLLVLYDRKNPQHIAFMINETEVVEAYCNAASGIGKVLRQRLDARRVVSSVFRFPESREKAALWGEGDSGNDLLIEFMGRTRIQNGR